MREKQVYIEKEKRVLGMTDLGKQKRTFKNKFITKETRKTAECK